MTPWEKYHKRFDSLTNTWDIFPDPIPTTVLHYSQLLSADSPNHPPPPSLPALPEYRTPYDFDRYDPLSEDNNIPATSSKGHDIDDDRISLGDNGSDSNELEETNYFAPSESAASIPGQWESSTYDRKWQAADPSPEQDGHFNESDTLYKFSNHRDIL